MLKHLTAALVAASLFGAPVLVTAAEAAQPAAKTLVTKPVAKVVVKHKRYAHHRKHHRKHVRHWRHYKKHIKHVRHFKPANAALKQAPAKTTVAK